MKIGISCYPTFGGSGIVATELAMALASGGDEVHVISYAMPSRLSFINANLFYHEVVVPHYPLFEYPPYSLALATQIVEVARHQRLDLIHVHYAVPNAVSAVLAREMLLPQPLKVVTTLHGTDITLVGNDPNYLETTRFGIVRSDGVTAVSEALREATQKQLGIGTHIEVVPNFIDPDRYEQAKAQNGARRWGSADERLLVHISNFRPVKRVLDVVEIFHRVHREVPSRLLLVGDGPERPKVEQYCRDSGICSAITFIGNLPLVEEVLV
ncbi:MAG: N-acetyl-alpha-D-glucosaminyl L-malate synthase BshA, partial [Thermoanaerobaculia bacterium]